MHLRERLKYYRAILIGLDPGFLNLYYRYFFKPILGSFEHRLEELSKGKQSFRFLQIGGNDGFTNDPIFKFTKKADWQGIVVEPQKDVFKNRLEHTYRFNKNIILRNVAITDKTEVRKLFKISVSDSRWATGLASFKKEVLIKHIQSERILNKAKRENIALPNTPENWISFEEVECITIDDLLREHNFEALDLLQIDTEGYDYEIVKRINFNNIRPAIICYEHVHLSSEDQQACSTLLTEQGYQIEQFDSDTMAVMR